MMVKNRDQAVRIGQLSQGEPAWFIAESERTTYLEHVDHSITFKIALHELFGHGTGKLLSELNPGKYNFDINNPLINPLTGQPIKTWYSQGQRTSSVFGEMDMSLEECRAEAVAAYLAFNEGILATMGYSDSSEITAEDCEFLRNICTGVILITGQWFITCISHSASLVSAPSIATNQKTRYEPLARQLTSRSSVHSCHQVSVPLW
jgi:hypothetical protein